MVDLNDAIPAEDLSDGWKRCPTCGFQFKPSDRNAIKRNRHVRCGQLLDLEAASPENPTREYPMRGKTRSVFDTSPEGDDISIHVHGPGAFWPKRRCACCGAGGCDRYVTIEAQSKASGPTGGAVYSSTITHTARAEVPVCSSCFEHQRDYHQAEDWGGLWYLLAIIGVVVLDIWVMFAGRDALADLLGMSSRDVWMVVHPSALVLMILLPVLIWKWNASILDRAKQNRRMNCKRLARPVEYRSLSVPVLGDRGDPERADHVFWFANADYAQDFVEANPGVKRPSGKKDVLGILIGDP